MFDSFDDYFIFPSTYERKEELWNAFKQAQEKARNDLKCLHRAADGTVSVSSSSPNINRFLVRRGDLRDHP